MKTRTANRNRKVLLIFLLFFFLLAGFLALELRLRPLLEAAVIQRLHETVTSIVNQSVGKILSKEETAYETLITFEKDDGGKITAMKTNMQTVNLLKTEIIDQVLEQISQLEKSEVSIPVGTLTGWGALSGRGPSITPQVQPLATSQAEFHHKFTAAGINQTRHQILLKITVELRLLLPGNCTETTVTADIPIAETVIIGNIPGNYTYFQDGGDLSSIEKSGILYED